MGDIVSESTGDFISVRLGDFVGIRTQAAQTLEPRARFIKVNVDENPQAASQYGVQGIPALFAFRGGKVAASQAGVTDGVALRNWVQQLEA